MVKPHEDFYILLYAVKAEIGPETYDALVESYKAAELKAYKDGWRNASNGFKADPVEYPTDYIDRIFNKNDPYIPAQKKEELEPTNKELARQVRALMQIIYTLSRAVEKPIHGNPADEYVRSSMVKYGMPGKIRGPRESLSE